MLMRDIVMIVLMIVAFGFGYFAVGRFGKFMDRNFRHDDSEEECDDDDPPFQNPLL